MKKEKNNETWNHKITHDLHKNKKNVKQKELLATDFHGFTRINTEEKSFGG